MHESILAAILGWREMRSGCHLQALVHHVGAVLNAPITQSDVLEAIEILSRQELIAHDGPTLRLVEPDRREFDLYGQLETLLSSPTLRIQLGLSGTKYVFQRTATGGPLGRGLLSRPDFTLAAIQSWRFNPQRTLEVYSFEVKNRAGTALPAVYEAVAHGRMVHHPYLVCPRSQFHPDQNKQMEEGATREGVGLMLFDLTANDGEFSIRNLEIIAAAVRRTPDPFLVQQHLEDRLTVDNQDRLAHFAGAVE